MISISHLTEHLFEQRKGGVEHFVQLLNQASNSSFNHQIVFKKRTGESYGLIPTINGVEGCEIASLELGSNLSRSDNAVRLSKADLIHIHQVMPYGLRPLIKLQYTNPTIFTLHDYFPFCQKVHYYPNKNELCQRGASIARCTACIGSNWSWLPLLGFFGYRMRLVKKFLDGLQAIILPNEDLLSEIPKEFQFKTVVIPYAVPCSTQLKSFKKKGFIYVGAMAAHKGIFQLLKDLDALGFEERIDLYGPEPLNGMPPLPKFARYKGVLRDRLVMQHYKALLLPSVWKETGPLVVLEALEEGIPVVARKGSMSSTFSNSPSIQFFSSARELLKLQIPDFIVKPKELPNLKKVISMHHEVYTKVWESYKVRYNG